MTKLEGKVAFIAGSAKGIGKAIAECFAAEGASVACADIDVEGAGAVASRIEASGGHALAIDCDVTDSAAVASAVAATVDAFGGLHVVSSNAAAITAPRPLAEMEESEWRRAMDINVTGSFLVCKHAIPAMRRAGGGSIVNISSIAGIGQSLQQEPAYAASKGAIRIFTKVTAAQHAKDGIRCNSIHPGPVDTEMFHQAFPDREEMDKRLRRIPLGRMGTVKEMVTLVLYLASDDSGYMSGSEILIDGGAMAQ